VPPLVSIVEGEELQSKQVQRDPPPALFQDFVPVSSDPFVQRLIDDSAIAIGKTNTPEGGLGSHTYNKLGRTCNPTICPNLREVAAVVPLSRRPRAC
jgi:hypothetical protein